MRAKVCIFGGTGFLGRHLCEHLHRLSIDAVVTSVAPDREFISHSAPSIKIVELTDPTLWDHVAKATMVVYLGARSRPGTNWNVPDYEISQNVVPTTKMIGRVIEANPSCHIVYASSGGQIYGDGHVAPIRESAVTSPPTAYALGKQLVEHSLDFYARTHGTSITVLRIANPVGRWQIGRRHGFFTAAVQAALSQTELSIYGDGCNQRDYFDADDLAALLCTLAQNPNRNYPPPCHRVRSLNL